MLYKLLKTSNNKSQRIIVIYIKHISIISVIKYNL